MTSDFQLVLLRRCIDTVAGHLGADESVVAIRMGRTRPGRQVFHYFKVDIAKLDPTLSNAPKDRRQVLVEINQDSIDSARIVVSPWLPWDNVYSD